MEKIALITRAIPLMIAYNVPNAKSTNIPNVISDSFIANILPRRFKGILLRAYNIYRQ